MWSQNGRCRQVVAIWRYPLAQVWLFSHFRLVLFWLKNIGAKAAHKMLAKLIVDELKCIVENILASFSLIFCFKKSKFHTIDSVKNLLKKLHSTLSHVPWSFFQKIKFAIKSNLLSIQYFNIFRSWSWTKKIVIKTLRVFSLNTHVHKPNCRSFFMLSLCAISKILTFTDDNIKQLFSLVNGGYYNFITFSIWLSLQTADLNRIII